MSNVWKGVLLLLWSGFCSGADSSIYTYTGNDGSVYLSNVPSDQRYVVLIPEFGEIPRSPVSPSKKAGAGASPNRGSFAPVIDRVASQYGLDSAFLHAVIAVESNYNPSARSAKGASGLMQLMPETAKRYGVADAFDPEQNIDGGARYLRDLSKMFDGDLSLTLAAYNAGENSVLRNQNRIPKIRETLDYVPKVLARYYKNQGL